MMSPNNYPAEKFKSDQWKFGFSEIMYIFILKFIYKQQIHQMKSMSSIISEKRTFHCHEFILGARSPMSRMKLKKSREDENYKKVSSPSKLFFNKKHHYKQYEQEKYIPNHQESHQRDWDICIIGSHMYSGTNTELARGWAPCSY